MTHIGQLLHGPNALWPTQSKFWVSHSPSGVLGGLESLSVKTEPSHCAWLSTQHIRLSGVLLRSQTVWRLELAVRWTFYIQIRTASIVVNGSWKQFSLAVLVWPAH